MPSKKEIKTDTRTVEVVDSSYQPSKAQPEEDMSIDRTSYEVARALTQTVNVRRVRSARSKAASAKNPKPSKK